MRMSMKRFGVTRLTEPAFLALGVAVAVQCVAEPRRPGLDEHV